jgi:hypothetical protein
MFIQIKCIFQLLYVDLQAFSNYCRDNSGGSTEKCLELKSKALYKSASKKLSLALCQNCLQKLRWHFAKTAYKNLTGTLPKLPTKTYPALLNLPLLKHCWHF